MLTAAVLVFVALFGMMLVPVGAQETVVTEDMVNEISSRMYCPVCENIPLDDCGTAACQDWRAEIRLFLEDGWTEEEIRADFVARFGDRVVGVPTDPVLRGLSLITPWVLSAIVLVIVVFTMMRAMEPKQTALNTATDTAVPDADDLRAQLERDIQG